MQFTTKTILIILCSVVLLPLIQAEPLSIPQINQPAPTFSLINTQSELQSLSDFAYPGPEKSYKPQKVVVLDFFRTDCAPCKNSLPKLVALHNKFKNKKVKIILIALLEEEAGDVKLERYFKAYPVPFTVLQDNYGVVGKKYVRNGDGFQIPMTFVIDQNGVLRHIVSFIDDKAEAELHKMIEGLLK